MSEIKKINVNGVDYDLASKYSHVHNNKNELDNLSTLYRDKNKANKAYAPSVKKTLTGPFIIENGVDGNLIDWSIWGTNVGNKNTTTGKYDIDITVSSKNMIPYPFYYTSRTINGITFTDNGDGTITANGTATADTIFMLHDTSWDNQTPIALGTYYLSGCPKGGSKTTYQLGFRIRTDSSSANTATSIDYGDGTKVTLASGEPRFDTYILIYENATVKNILFKPQLETGSVATEFELYSEPQTVKISLDSALNGLLTRSSAKVELPVFNRTTIYTFNTSTQPTEFKVKYSQNIETYVKENSLDIKESHDLYLPVDENTGVVPCTKNALSINAKNYQIYGNSIQDGTPTPTTPVEVESVGELITDTEDEHQGEYKVQNRVCGNNLMNINDDFDLWRNNYPPLKSVDGNTITYSANGGTARWGIYVLKNFGNSITISAKSINVNGGYVTILTTNTEPTGNTGWTASIDNITTSKTNYKRTITTTDRYIGIYVSNIVSSNTVSFDEFMVSNSDDVEYEPYRENTITTYLDEPLRKIGDYADYIDYKNQKVIRNVGSIVYKGIENWNALLPNTYANIKINNAVNYHLMLSNRYVYNATNSDNGVIMKSGYLYVYDSTNMLNMATWKAQLTTWNTEGNPLKVYYALATPTEEDITLEPLPLESGANNILTDTSIHPSNAMVQYYMDLKSIVSENALDEAEDIIELQAQVDKLTLENEKSALIQEKCTLTEETSGVTVQIKNAVDINAIDYRIYGDSPQETDNGDFTNDSGEALVVPTGCIDVGYLKLSGDSVQNGTPTPTAPVDVESVGELITDESSEHTGKYKVVTNVCGKNLIPYPYYNSSRTISGITFTVNENGSITANGTATSDTVFHCGGKDWSAQTPILKGNYFLSGCPAGGSASTYEVGLRTKAGPTGTAEIKARDIGSGATVSITDDNTRFDIYLDVKSGVTINNLTFSPQLEIGSTATTYEKYTATSMVAYLDEPLRKIGDYADCIDYENQKVIRVIKEKILNGTETYSKNSVYSTTDMYVVQYSTQDIVGGTPATLSNRFLRTATTTINTFRSASLNLIFGVDATLINTVNDWKAQLATWDTEGNPLKVYYALATPTSESITIESVKTSTGYTAGQSIVDMNALKGILSATMYKSYPYPSPQKLSEVENVGDLVTVNGVNKYKVETKIMGKNLIPYPYKNTTKIINGVTFTDNGDGTITVNGTATANTSYNVVGSTTTLVEIEAGSYCLSGCPSGGSSTSYEIVARSGSIPVAYNRDYGEGCSFVLDTDTVYYCAIIIRSGATVNNLVFKPQLEYGSTATSYEPYKENTITTYLDEPLRKIGDYADYIDYKNQKVIRNVGVYAITGNENWIYNSTSKYFILENFPLASATLLSNYYVNATASSGDGRISANVSSNKLFMSDYKYISASSFKTAMAELYTSTAPVLVYFLLQTPTEEDIIIEPLPLESGANNVLCSTMIQPSDINVDYFKDPDKELNEIKSTLASLQSQINKLKNS